MYEFRQGWAWPKQDQGAWAAVFATLPDLEKAVDLCKQRRIAVQAGGNCGVWPHFLAQHFADVYTFEPSPENFPALVLNTPKNVVRMQAALGAGPGMVKMQDYSPDNLGAQYCAPDGNIPTLVLDWLKLPACDLLALDVEGYETQAILGAQDTILAHKPVILFEDKHADRYPFKKPEDVLRQEFGYEVAARVHRDVIMTCTS